MALAARSQDDLNKVPKIFLMIQSLLSRTWLSKEPGLILLIQRSKLWVALTFLLTTRASAKSEVKTKW